MEITKPNDILVTTLKNPGVTPYDLLSKDINGDNTSFLSKEEYKSTNYVQDFFKGQDGKFDNIAFDKAYQVAQNNYYNLTSGEYLKDIDKIAYSPFDITRPKMAKTMSVSATLEKDYNPFETKKGWTGVGSEDASDLSLREIAQKSKVWDPSTKTWSNKSLNDLSIWDKLFGDTLVYAQYDSDGSHTDPVSGYLTNHKKGDWRVNEDGNLFTEKAAGKELYGKQVVSSSDTWTTDGSLVDQFNFLDSDGRQKSITGTVFKTAAEIAPLVIPGVGTYYAGVRTAVAMASVLPTFYKAIEGAFIGDEETSMTKGATQLENWMSKFTTGSTSDEGGQSMLSFEQMASQVSSIFSQIYEQRAAASLSKMIMGGDKMVDEATERLAKNINSKLFEDALKGKIKMEDIGDLSKAAMSKIPELESVMKRQSQLSKSLSLGYMALTSTSDIYGQALQGGYDRRTAGFAALASMAGQYTIMMNNRMGDWFLDKTTGYSVDVNRALISKTVTPWLAEVEQGFAAIAKGEAVAGKKMLGNTFQKIRKSMYNFFTSPPALGEAMWKNSMVEGVEEVTEQMVLDTTKGIVDALSYFGVTKNQGSFGGWDTVFSKEGMQNYLANFLGGVVGGAMFEFHREVMEPYFNPNSVTPETKKSLYELVAGGHKDEVIKTINNLRPSLGNKYISAINADGTFQAASEKGVSQADMIADRAIEMVNTIDDILNMHDIGKSDEEIVMKAIRDKIVIDALKKAAPEGKLIGLEGLVLEDYKKRMSNVVDLELEARNLDETTSDGKKRGQEIKDQLKTNIDGINDILEGKNGAKYFRQATWYLNKKISGAFINMDKATYAKKQYGVDIDKLPVSGVGLTQEGLDKEWKEFTASKDLRKDLDVADAAYIELEGMLNGAIADYVESGYDEEHAKTLKNILDLKETIKVFNTTGSETEKKIALERFIKLNNELEGSGKNLIAPWTVVHNDIFDQFDNLGLIKKVTYKTDLDGKLTENVESFTQDELDTVIPGTNITKAEHNKLAITGFFKKFPLNPMNAEGLIDQFNGEIISYNKGISQKIAILEAKPDLTPEEEANLEKLRADLIDIRIDSINNTPVINGLIQSSEDQVRILLEKNKITLDQYDEYLAAKKSENLYKESFDEILGRFETTDWRSLDVPQFIALIDDLQKSGLYDATVTRLLASSADAQQVLMEVEDKLRNPEITSETFEAVKDSYQRFFDVLKMNVNTNNSLLGDDNFIETEKELAKIKSELQDNINKVKPEILKLHNYAFEMLMKQLEAGSLDKEVFNEAEALYHEELNSLLANVFPTGKNVTLTQLSLITEATPNIIAAMDATNEDFKDSGEGFSYNDNLKDILEEIKALQKLNPLDFGIFQTKEVLDFITNNFDENASMQTIRTTLEQATEAFNFNKRSFDNVNKFIELQGKLTGLKSNSIYDFIRKFTLTLNSNPNNKVTKLIDILKREELTLKSNSTISNYLSDGIREADVNQAIDNLEMIKAVVNAMATTTVDYEDPIGFISARQKYAEKYKLDDDVTKLKTISSDVAAMMVQDIDAIINKLSFLKDLTKFNAGKRMAEEEIIRGRVEEILLSNWKNWASKLNPSFIPAEKINEILLSPKSNSRKLMEIENLVYDKNVDNKIPAFESFLKELEFTDADDSSKIDKEIKALSNWDLATYFGTVLVNRSEDFHTRSYITVNGDFAKAPFFTQEFVARTTKASTINPELFAKIYEYKKNTSKLDASFITIILGNAGSGKTTAVFGLDLEHFKQTNDNTNIWLSAPTDTQVNNLEKAVLDSNGPDKISLAKHSKTELFEKLGILSLINNIETEIATANDPNKETKYIKLVDGIITLSDEVLNNKWLEEIAGNLENLPNLLLIDEVTHYSFAEMYILNAISVHSYYNDSLNFMKIIGAGDPGQLGYLARVGDNYYEYNIGAINAVTTPKLWVSVRSSNNQKRLNTERYVRITRDVTDIYKKNKIDYDKSKNETLSYLEDNSDLNILSYFEDENRLNGDKIVTELDLNTVTTLKNIITKDPNAKIGILTSDGKLPEAWNKLLSAVGIIDAASMGNVVLYSPKNIQGSEVDYIIFDANLIDIYDKTRDNLKALYTFMTRSKNGSIIVDKDNILKEKYKIENGAKDIYTTPFELMTPEVIEQAKQVKKDFLKELLGENPKPADDFKWKTSGTAKPAEEEVILDSYVVSPLTPAMSTSTKAEQMSKGEPTDFKILLHSFYNNPGAFIDSSGTIKVNANNLRTDLNGLRDVPPDQAKKVIAEWLHLKNHILFNKNEDSVLSTDFENYLKSIFGDMPNTEHIGYETILTASTFDADTNTPYKKKGFDSAKVLKGGETFINLTAKITWGQKTHYLTLATFGTQEEIIKKATSMAQNTDELVQKFRSIEAGLRSKKLIEFKIKDLDKVNFNTSTLIEQMLDKVTKKPEEYPLTSLEEEFPGMYFSEIRMYPGREEVFYNLINRYTFGEKRTEAQLKDLHKKLKNRPYIVVSYKNDLDGSVTGTKTQAKLVPIGSNARGFDTLTKEVNDLLAERKASLSATNRTISGELNAKTETLLNRSDILDCLIEWGITPDGGGTLLDTLSKKIEFSFSDKISGNKTSVVEIFGKFRNESALTNAKLEEVLEKVKAAIKKHGKDLKEVKKEVIGDLKGTTGWHWTFFNIFGFEKIIAIEDAREFVKLISAGTTSSDTLDEFDKTEGGIEMRATITKLLNAIKNKKFYYSVPIKPAAIKGEAYQVNPYISGEKGFDKNTFGDKFYLNVAPEGPKLLMDLDVFIDSEVITGATPPKPTAPTAPVVVEPVEPEVEEVEEEEDLTVGEYLIKAIKDPTAKKLFIEVGDLVSQAFPEDSDIAENIETKLKEIRYESETFEDSSDQIKVETILRAVGFGFKQGIAPGSLVVNLPSIATALNIDRMAEKDLIMKLQTAINNLLSSCK